MSRPIWRRSLAFAAAMVVAAGCRGNNGGLFWKASNSLSVGDFPFDTTHAARTNDPDSLVITLNSECRGCRSS